jgi:8-oxo-dGTP pyrophosphatase MutT (NUDIX family)
MLLIARTERTGDVWSGQVAFPGGRKAAGDENLYETALRESNEEVGIGLVDDDLLGVLPVVYARAHRIGVLPFVFRLRTKVSILANREVAESFWVPLRFFEDVQPSQTVVDFEGKRAFADCYTFDSRVIWGLTFRIINHLIGRTTRPEDWHPI